MTNTKTAVYNGITVSLIQHDNEVWLTATDLGHCLGYNQANARQGCLNLYNRHDDEFTEKDTCVINLMTQGQARSTRVFSRTGCNLLSFFANTKRAKQFRAWAKHALISQTSSQVSVHALQDALLQKSPLWQSIKHYADMGLGNAEIARLVTRSTTTVRTHRREMERLGLLTPPLDLFSQQQHAQQALPNLRGDA